LGSRVGPRNVALWQMAFQLDTGRPGEAMETAARVDLTGLPAVRQVYFYLDMARGLADMRRASGAVRMLLTAGRIGPQHTHSSTAARETARSLLHHARHHARREAAGSALHGCANAWASPNDLQAWCVAAPPHAMALRTVSTTPPPARYRRLRAGSLREATAHRWGVAA
jgi:hypothetical protein